MWDHVRVVRWPLLLLSLLTFSSLQERRDQSAGCWTAAWLVPVLHSLLLTAGCLAATVMAENTIEMMRNAVVFLSLLNALLMMLYFLRSRARLRSLLHRLAVLERSSAAFRRAGEITTVRVQFAMMAGLCFVAVSMSQIQFFHRAELRHPYYPNPLLVPAVLQTPAWYWVILTLQMFHDLSVTVINMAFDLVLIGLGSMVSLLLERLSRQLGVDDGSDAPASSASKKAPEEGSFEDKLFVGRVSAIEPEVQEDSFKDSEILSEKNTISKRTQAIMSVKVGPLVGTHGVSPSAEDRLRQLVTGHRAVRGFASDAAEFCSVPLFCLYTSVTAALLLSVYTTISMLNAAFSAVPTNVAYIGLALLRLVIVSSAGSRLIQQGEQLHAALIDASWSEGELAPAARLSLYLLLEKTRQPPVLHGWGLFTAQKTTMLSMLGFVLTYTVILMQMVH